MPIKNAPAKIKITSYITHVERLRIELAAKAAQLTFSEWVREAVIDKLREAKATPAMGGHELLNDFVFGDPTSSKE